MIRRTPYWRRAFRRFQARQHRDLLDLDARGRMGDPPRPLLLAVATFVLMTSMGMLLFLVGKAETEAGYLIIAGLGIFGLAIAIGFAMVVAQYRLQQNLDEARRELLALHTEMAGMRSEYASTVHDARAVIAAAGATIHSLEATGDQPHIAELLAEQLLHMRKVLSPSTGTATPVALADVIEGVRPIASAHGVALDIDVDGDIDVLVDRARAIQILDNLVDNARKYAPGSTVWITSGEAGPFVNIAVEDDGPGVTDDPEVLFRPGVRKGGDAQGFGMGLAAARRQAESMGGALWYEPRPSGGARFVLKLRRAGAEGA